ncbi:MAG: sodium:calcium antiporter, partial [Deltaproteobacteria bacterium]|nr:sodium:calcium antiporter [Deltaproteobacteria bacterium]
MIFWMQFLGLVIAISLSGYFLSVYGDQIAELSGLGKSWIGATLIAMVTSLPELG